MFTGIITRTGTFKRVERRGGGARICIGCEPWSEPLCTGESVCVHGACLTVAAVGKEEFTCDVLRETLNRTSLGRKPRGARLNLERALRAADRMGGHIVTGHVDGVGRVARVELLGGDRILRLECDPALLSDVAPKGSITLDGVSLTVVEAGPRFCTVHIIPFTWRETALSQLDAGGEVNIETDILAKYARREAKQPVTGSGGRLTLEDLGAAGYV